MGLRFVFYFFHNFCRKTEFIKVVGNITMYQSFLIVPQFAIRMEDMEWIFRFFWDNYCNVNVNILFGESKDVLGLYTYFPFSNTHCRKIIPTKINSFVNGTPTRPMTNYFPYKMNTFYGCKMSVVVWESPPYILVTKNEWGIGISGFEARIMKEVMKKVNFTMIFHDISNGTFDDGKVLVSSFCLFFLLNIMSTTNIS